MSVNLPVLQHLRPHLSTGWRHLQKCYWLLVIPAIGCVVLAIAYLLIMPQTWKASQSLIVRDDLLGEAFKPGRFTSQETQKNAQETILHIARNPSVIRTALQTVGPTAANSRPDWIDDQLIEDTKSSISIVAPNGAEFGKTEVLVLMVKAAERSRARVFVEALADEIETHLRRVRQDQLLSMQEELRLSVQQISRQFDLVADKIRQIEANAGSDLPALRSLLDRNGSSNDVQRSLEQIRLERRAAETELEVASKQLELLKNIESDPQQFAVSSNELLTMQPIFKRLREGLADAELRLMVDSGKYEPTHPAVVHGKEVVEQTKAQIQREASSFVQGLKHQQALIQQKLTRLIGVEREYDARLTGLGKQRVEYEVLAREMEKRGESLGKAKTDLAEIQSLAESVEQVNLITRVGEAQVDLRPVGMSKKAVLFLALLGGLAIGGALIALVYDPKNLGPASGRADNPKTLNSGKSQWSAWFRTKSKVSPPVARSQDTQTARPYGLGGASALGNSNLQTPVAVFKTKEISLATMAGSECSSNEFNNEKMSSEKVNSETVLQTSRSEQGVITSDPKGQVSSPVESVPVAATTLPAPLAQPELELANTTVQPSIQRNLDDLKTASSACRPAPVVEASKATLLNSPLVPALPSPLKADRFGNPRQREAVQKTVDLEDLKRTLAEAAAQSRPGEEDSEELRTRLEALNAEKERKRSVTQRLSDLSQTISAYCEPVRKKKSADNEGAEAE